MPFGAVAQLPPVKTIWRIERDTNAFFSEQQFGDFLPRLAPLAQLVNEIKMRFQNAMERFAAALSLCRFGHQWPE